MLHATGGRRWDGRTIAIALAAACLLAVPAPAAVAKPAKAKPRTWYVSATARRGGHGSRKSPFRSLARVQRASRAGDTIVILAVPKKVAPLNGGIRLRPRQRLIGAGPPVAGHTRRLKRLPAIANTSGKRLAGDAVRLARNSTVRNVVVKAAHRGAVYGLDSVGVRIVGNDVSGVNTSCTNGFLVQPFNVPTGIPGVMIPASPAVAPQNGWAGIMVDGRRAAGRIDIERNRLHDSSCADGIDVRAMGSSNLRARIRRNTVTHIAEGAAGSSTGAVGSILAIGMQALDSAVLHVSQDRNTETHIGSPGADCEGQFANVAGSGRIYDTVDHNRFAHGIGGTSCNGFETIVSSGDGTIVATLRNSTFRHNVGDMFEEGNLGSGSTMRFVMENVVADGTSVRGGNPPGSSDGGSNPIPFNIGDCMVAGHNGAADSTTFVMRRSVLRHCNNGITFGSNVGQGNGNGPAKQLVADIRQSVIEQNAKYGLHLGNFTPMDLLHIRVADTRITGNGEPGASFEAQATGVGTVPNVRLDLGRGGLGSPGRNCLASNGSADVEATSLPVVAKHDWWGHPGAPRSSQARATGVGAVTVDGGLASRPGCGLP
jgi:hypothetical protein